MAVAQVKEVSYTLLQVRDEGKDTRGNALCRTPYDMYHPVAVIKHLLREIVK